ncbi:Gfo/Idh/MocA family oxidoreductase [Phenylobacterium sp. LjRoot225]|uniref:Gfo/Idh/MocA family protein n=1 Tax=Phenylobacterium sp. LjRoot225 TaxID=3342285 RepID=UPI003ECFEE6D
MTLEPPMIRVGLLGHGQAGAILHAPLIEAVPDFRISAVATSRTASLAERRDAPRQVRQARELIEADDVDLVVIATPNELHFEQAAAALAAGKHVVIDKPFAATAAEADRLIDLAEAKGRMLTVFHNRRLDGDFLGVRQAIASGELGELLLFEARWDRFRPTVLQTWKNRAATPGIGQLWDLGPHLVDQALQLFGPPDRVTADIAIQRQGGLADDYFELTLTYGRMRCILSASAVIAAPRPRFAAHGTAASFLTYGVDPIEAALHARRHPQAPDFFADLATIPAELVSAEGREARKLAAGDWTGFYRQVAMAIREGAPPPVAPAEAREVTALIEAAYAAAGQLR